MITDSGFNLEISSKFLKSEASKRTCKISLLESRKSIKTKSPWSRKLDTQPATVTSSSIVFSDKSEIKCVRYWSFTTIGI